MRYLILIIIFLMPYNVYGQVWADVYSDMGKVEFREDYCVCDLAFEKKVDSVKIIGEPKATFLPVEIEGRKLWVSEDYVQTYGIDEYPQNYEEDQGPEEFWIDVHRGNIREGPNTDSNVKDQLNKGHKLEEISEEGNWVKVSYDVNTTGFSKRSGWVHKSIVSEKEVEELSESDIRRRKFVKNNPNISESYKNDILEGTIRIGMTKRMVRASWGEPQDINETITSNMVREQWVYGYSAGSRKYVYFENGELVTIQN